MHGVELADRNSKRPRSSGMCLSPKRKTYTDETCHSPFRAIDIDFMRVAYDRDYALVVDRKLCGGLKYFFHQQLYTAV